jgi:catechol 2,3-dioxygenase-like lactoylglutathione lyase family enzyme
MKRLDKLEIATSDLDDAAAIYRRNFGFEVVRSPDGASATIAIGDATIQLKSAPSVAQSGEGMAALWLEAEDLDQVVASLERAGVNSPPIRKEDGRRVLAIDPSVSSQVPLFIFDRKA